MSRRILIVLTSHDDPGGLRPTGFYVSEAAHPWQAAEAVLAAVDEASATESGTKGAR